MRGSSTDPLSGARLITHYHHLIKRARLMNLDEVRQFFAEEIHVVANIQTGALVSAFAKVPREQFLGPGPWQIPIIDTCGAVVGGAGQTKYRSTEDADPRRLYHNVSIAIDPSRNLNNGQPGSLASWIDAGWNSKKENTRCTSAAA